MKTHESVFSIDQMARVSRSGYYNYVKRVPSVRRVENDKLVGLIKTIFQDSYGSPRIHAELKDRGFKCSRQKVARLMRMNHIQAKMYKKFKKTTKRSGFAINHHDLVQQNFIVDQPNRIWVADLTYICVNKEWAYLAVVLDLFSWAWLYRNE
jgi:putative transposase